MSVLSFSVVLCVTGFDKKSGRLVAVKRIKSEAISEGSHSPQKQFENEVDILSS